MGVAHPTGSYGMWHAMFAGGILKPSVIRAVKRLISSDRAGWIPDELFRDEDAEGLANADTLAGHEGRS